MTGHPVTEPEILARLERYVYGRNSTAQKLVVLRGAVWWARSVAVALNGSLGNSGFLQVRSLEGSLSSTRLVPTVAEWKSAYKEFLKTGAASVEVAGIRSYQLPEARLILSEYQAGAEGSRLSADAEVRDVSDDLEWPDSGTSSFRPSATTRTTRSYAMCL